MINTFTIPAKRARSACETRQPAVSHAFAFYTLRLTGTVVQVLCFEVCQVAAICIALCVYTTVNVAKMSIVILVVSFLLLQGEKVLRIQIFAHCKLACKVNFCGYYFSWIQNGRSWVWHHIHNVAYRYYEFTIPNSVRGYHVYKNI